MEVHHLHRQPALHNADRGQVGNTGSVERPVQGLFFLFDKKLLQGCRKPKNL